MRQASDVAEGVNDQTNTDGQIQEEEHELRFKDALRWYFSPYLTTLITGPMLLVLVALAALCTMGVIVRFILLIARYPILLLLGIPGIPLTGIHLYIIYSAFMGIPRIWRTDEWAVSKRLLAISGAFVGSIAAAYIVEQIEVAIFTAVVGRSWLPW